MRTWSKLNLALAATAVLISGAAKADGFLCGTLDRETTIQVYNHVDPARGTRNAAVMVISDAAARPGNRTLARFTDLDMTLENQGAYYTARVDLSPSAFARGEFLGSIAFEHIRDIELWVNFSYGNPIPPGAYLSGELVVNRLDGQSISKPLSCVRYLKNPQ